MHEEPLALSLSTLLPLGWQSVQTGVATETNPRVLAGLEALENPPPAAGETEAWWQRLEAKTDLLLAHTVLAATAQPPREKQNVELRADGLSWHGPAQQGLQECWLELSPLVPPLVLQVAAAGQSGVFLNLTPALQEQLERLIFRRHRRELKRRKEAPSAG